MREREKATLEELRGRSDSVDLCGEVASVEPLGGVMRSKRCLPRPQLPVVLGR